MVSSSTGAMNAVLHKLTNLIREDHSLRQELVRMNQLLHKFATREVSDAQVKEWMRQAREVAYDIEDWVDLSIHPPRRNLKRKLDRDSYDIDDRINITFHQGGLGDAPEPEIAEQIQDFIDRIVGAIERCEAYHLLGKAPNADAADIADPSSCTDIGTHPQLLYESKAPLVAIRGMIDDLVDDLKDDGQEKLKVVSIVGNRGLGKTTIAKEVYRTLQRGFQCAAFVRIAGPNQPIRRILNDIYSQVHPGFCEMLAEQQLVNDLRKYLSNKRYLLTDYLVIFSVRFNKNLLFKH